MFESNSDTTSTVVIKANLKNSSHEHSPRIRASYLVTLYDYLFFKKIEKLETIGNTVYHGIVEMLPNLYQGIVKSCCSMFDECGISSDGKLTFPTKNYGQQELTDMSELDVTDGLTRELQRDISLMEQQNRLIITDVFGRHDHEQVQNNLYTYFKFLYLPATLDNDEDYYIAAINLQEMSCHHLVYREDDEILCYKLADTKTKLIPFVSVHQLEAKDDDEYGTAYYIIVKRLHSLYAYNQRIQA